MKPSLSEPVQELLATQAAMASRRQLRRLGMDAAEVRWWLRHGWSVVLPGIVWAAVGIPDARQRLVAALLYAGDGAVLSGPTAARLLGSVNAEDGGRAHVAVPAGRFVTPNPAVVVRRTRRPDPGAGRDGPLVIASATRAFADAAREAPARRAAMAVVIEGVQKDLVTLGDLRAELDDGPRCGSSFLRSGIDAAATGAWSLPEYDLLTLLQTSRRFPVVWANPRLRSTGGARLPTPDCWLDDVALAIQVHSRRHHSGVEDWERTVERDGVFSEYGVPFVAVTPRTIRQNPSGVLDRVSRAHRARLGLPRPGVLAAPRCAGG